jgi:hypothetical protein
MRVCGSDPSEYGSPGRIAESCAAPSALGANMCETSGPSSITVGRGKKSHFDDHKQDKHFFRCVGSFGA